MTHLINIRILLRITWEIPQSIRGKNIIIQIYYGKTLKIEFTLCNDKCKICKLIRKSDEQEKCEECKDNLKYYFNKDENLYVCLGIGENCPEEYPFFSSNNSLQCLKKCPEEYPFYSTNNSNNSFQCFKECPEDYPFLKENSSICQKDCDYDDLINSKCILNNKTTDSLKKVYNIFTDLISDNYNNEEIVFTIGDDLTFQLSNSLNEKSNLNSGTRKNNLLSVIDLGECETKLKIANTIDLSLPLIILKVESFYDNTGIKNVQYEIFNPVTKEKITDLSPCKEDPIDIYVPSNLDNDSLTIYEEMKDQGYDIFNPNDSFYNDICTKFTTVNNTDLTLNDRKNLFYNGSQIFCQENCVYQSINVKTSQAKCECTVSKSNEIDYETQVFSGFEIITSFYDVIKYSNFLILKCYKLVFSILGIKNNIGSIFLLVSFFFHIILTIIFLFTGINKIKDQISKILFCSINKVNIFSISINRQKCKNINEIKRSIFPQAPNKRNNSHRKIEKISTKRIKFNEPKKKKHIIISLIQKAY